MHRWLTLMVLVGTQCATPAPGSQVAVHSALPVPASSGSAPTSNSDPQTREQTEPSAQADPSGSDESVAPSTAVVAQGTAVTPTLADLGRAVRHGNWAEAQALSSDVPTPGLAGAYLQARLSLELGRFDEAIERLEALPPSDELRPLVDEDLRRARARAGQLDSIDRKSRLRLDPDDLLFAAERLLDDDQVQRAGVMLAEAAKHVRGRAEPAAWLHALRARWAVSVKQPYRAFVDWRWLATRTPASPFADGVVDQLAQDFPNYVLTGDEWKARIDALVDAGQADQLPGEFEHWRASRHQAPNGADELHYIGWAEYEARDFDRAAYTLAAAASASGRYAAHDGYYSGQAHARMGRQLAAIAAYQLVIEKHPKSSFAQLGALRIPQQYSLLGQWHEAVSAYSEFIDHHAQGEQLETAMRERAVARYGALEPERAAFEFRRLRALRPASTLAPLYRHLEALSLLGTPRAAEAIGLFETTRDERPLSFEGLMARLRLQQLARDVPPLAAPNAQGTSPPLPPLVSELESLGLFRESERTLTRLESELGGDTPLDRLERACRAHAELLAGRRRLLLGLSAAKQSSFYSNPAESPRWLWDCLYPKPYGDWVQEGAQGAEVPASLVYAIMRQESGFRPDVASPASAYGLMQIIAPTAREIAHELGDDDEAIDLYDAALNVRYGASYLGMLQRTFGGHPALTAASYNAGPGAAGLWFAAGQELPLEMFVARIPYDETRTYVMRVLANLAAYQLLDPELGAIDIPLSLR